MSGTPTVLVVARSQNDAITMHEAILEMASTLEAHGSVIDIEPWPGPEPEGEVHGYPVVISEDVPPGELYVFWALLD